MSERDTLDDGYLAPGSVVADRFEVIAMLGEGGMGAVYRAVQRGLRREVALKIIRPDRRQRASARERFLREARVASLMRHPGVVGIYDFGEHEGALFLAMELLNGPALRDVVDEHLPLLSWPRVVAITTAIADVLDAAGSVGLVHRDLKPENVILHREPNDTERVVVVDFGLAFVADGEEELRRMTREGVLTGTPEYMSPEQCRGSLELGPPSDVYALGVMLHEMVVGKTPFRGETALVISRHLFVPPKPMRELAPEGREVPALVEELVQRMMAKEPNDRPSAAQVRDRLAFLELGASERMSAHGSDEARMGRAARMISRGGSSFPPAFAAPSALGVAWVGARDEAFELALGANGIHVVPLDEASVIFVADGSPLAAWTGRGVPVVAAATSADVATLTELLRAGATDVFVRGAGADALAKKLLRAARKR